MTGIARRGHSLRVVRIGIELGALIVGWLLGGTVGVGTVGVGTVGVGTVGVGTVGVGTVVFALAIGPLVQFFLYRLQVVPIVARGRPDR